MTFVLDWTRQCQAQCLMSHEAAPQRVILSIGWGNLGCITICKHISGYFSIDDNFRLAQLFLVEHYRYRQEPTIFQTHRSVDTLRSHSFDCPSPSIKIYKPTWNWTICPRSLRSYYQQPPVARAMHSRVLMLSPAITPFQICVSNFPRM